MSPARRAGWISSLLLVTSLSAAACDGDGAGPGGGGGAGGGGGGGSGAEDPFAAPLGCASGEQWNPSGQAGVDMNPGKACLACHAQEGKGPMLHVAGTVYPLGHETDLCHGIDGTSPEFSDVKVEITDANGQVHTLKIYPTGNFGREQAGFAYPYTARVVSSKGERVMNGPQEIGDCNLCHTAAGGGNGSDAPGRIVMPL